MATMYIPSYVANENLHVATFGLAGQILNLTGKCLMTGHYHKL